MFNPAGSGWLENASLGVVDEEDTYRTAAVAVTVPPGPVSVSVSARVTLRGFGPVGLPPETAFPHLFVTGSNDFDDVIAASAPVGTNAPYTEIGDTLVSTIAAVPPFDPGGTFYVVFASQVGFDGLDYQSSFEFSDVEINVWTCEGGGGGAPFWEFSDGEWTSCGLDLPGAARVAGQLGTCGVEQYEAQLIDRTGTKVLDVFDGLTEVNWERRKDSVTVASVVANITGDCGALGDVDPYATGLRLLRNGDVVWEGPVYEVRERFNTVEVVARDVAHWLDVRVIRNVINDEDRARDAVLIARDVVREGFRYDDPNVLPYLQVVPGGTKLTRKTDPADRPYAGAELSDLARVGMDWVVVGRRIVLMPPDHHLGRAAQITHEDILGDWDIIKAGRDFASRQITAGEGALVARRGGKDRRYGLVEQVNNEQSLTTQEAVDNAAESRYVVTPRPPVWVSLDDGVTLRPETPVTIEELVPGVVFPGSFELRCTAVQQDFQLQRVSVSASEGSENVKIGATAIGYAAVERDATYPEVTVIGDSITAVNPDLLVAPVRWVDLLDNTDLFGQVRLGAVPGATTQTLRDAPLVDPRASDLTVVFLGANDLYEPASGVSPTQYGLNLEWFLANYPAGRQVVVYPWRWFPQYPSVDPPTEGDYQLYRAAAAAAAASVNAVFVDLSVLAPDNEQYMVDWIHANEEGHRFLASVIAAVL